MKSSTSTPHVELASRDIKPHPPEPKLARVISLPVMHPQPKNAGEAVSNACSGIMNMEGGDTAFYLSLLKPDMPYGELRDLAWNRSTTSKLPSEALHTARQAWAVRKGQEFLAKNPGLSLDRAKHQLSSELTTRKVPQRYVMEAMVALDSLQKGEQRNVSAKGQQLYYMLHASDPGSLSDTSRMMAFAKALDQQIAVGRINSEHVLQMCGDIHRSANTEEMPMDISLLMKLVQLDKAVEMGEEMPPSPPPHRPVPIPRKSRPKPSLLSGSSRGTNHADRMAGVGDQLKLSHTPSLNETQRVELKQAYGVTTVPIKLNGKEIAYLFTSSPDGKPKDRVLFSCHASGRNNRPKFQKDLSTTMLFAGTRNNILTSRTQLFAEGLAAGKARFTDDSQIYSRLQTEVTDYTIKGGIRTHPEDAARQLAEFRKQDVVNDFDYLLLDRNAQGLHMSDLMQALKESGISHRQMVNHLCRPQSSDAGKFRVLDTLDDTEALNLSAIDPDLDGPAQWQGG